MKRWLKKMRPLNRRPRLAKLPARRLGGQQLESRQLMAADIGIVDTTLAIQGSPLDDVAEVYVESGRVQVTVSTYNEAGEVVSEESDDFAVEDIDRIVFEGLSGDDLFVNDSAIDTVARGGGGNDTLLGGSGTNLLIGGVGDDLFLGGGGTIMVLAGPGSDVTIDALTPADSEPIPTETESEPTENLNPVEANDSVDPVDEVDDTQSNGATEIAVSDEEPSLSDEVAADADSHDPEDPACLIDDADAGDADPGGAETPEQIDPEASVETGDVGDQPPTDTVEPTGEATEDSTGNGETTGNGEAAGDETTAEEPTDVQEDVNDDTAVVDDTETIQDIPSDTDDIADTEPVGEVLVENRAEDPVAEDPVAEDEAEENEAEPIIDAEPSSEPTQVGVSESATPASEESMEMIEMETEVVDAPADPQAHEEDDCLNDRNSEPEVLVGESSELVGQEVVSNEEATVEADFETDNDVIFGGSGDDWLFGEGGNDLIFGNTSLLDDELLRSVISGRLQL